MFRVVWLQEVLDELTAIWLQADSRLRQAITAASHTIEQQLRANPYDCGESREDDECVILVYPLGAQIEVDPQQRIVWILNIWRFRLRGE